MTGPNLFLFAAPRAGSTQLARWLETHPDIALAPVKEPNHLSADAFPPDFVRTTHLDDVSPARYFRGARRRRAQFAVFRDRADYLRLFEDLDVPWRLDASTSYLSWPPAPARAARMSTSARAITLTRNPLERALSHYRLAVRTGRTRRPLGEELRDECDGITPPHARFLLAPSFQAPGVLRVAEVFGPIHHLALTFEDLIEDPSATLCQIAAFLDIDPAGFDLSVMARNSGVSPRFPALNAKLHESGAKTWLRRVLPPMMKHSLKPLWFDTQRPITVSQREHEALSRALAAAGAFHLADHGAGHAA